MTSVPRVAKLLMIGLVVVTAVALAWWAVALRSGESMGSGPDGMSVQRLHQAYFGQDPDEVGLTIWTARFANGESLVTLADEFSQSPEFAETYGSLSSPEFVEAAYRNVLGRAPDDSERSNWVGALESGTSRGQLMADLSDSAEYKRLTGAHTYGTRVLLIGDSLMADSGPLAETQLRELDYTIRVDARPGSGLLASHRPVDWLAEMQRHIESFDPDIVVVEFCCNHWPTLQPEGHPHRDIEAGTDEFYAAWAATVDEAAEILTSRGATLAWVHTPPVSDERLNALIDRLNAISEEAGRRHGFARIDWAVAVSDGTFQLDWGGDQVRDPDGLHFLPAGAERTAVATVAGVMRISEPVPADRG